MVLRQSYLADDGLSPSPPAFCRTIYTQPAPDSGESWAVAALYLCSVQMCDGLGHAARERIGLRTGYPPYAHRPSLVRTVDSWGIEAQARLARTHVCVVGVGSIGSIVLESLARTGVEEITIIDADLVEDRNLDRLIYADRHCLGVRKAKLAAAHVRRVATARRPVIRSVPLSIRTERAYRLAADADMIVCCVDKAEAREVLNYIAYANYLPYD